MSIQEAETQFYGIFPNAEHNVIKTGITLDVRDASDNKLPLEAYKIVKTYAAAESLVERKVDPNDDTVWYYDAYPGETISVVDDGPNNGLYVVMGTQDPSQNGLTLHRVIYSDDPSSAYTLQARSVDPSTSEVTVTPGTGYYGLSSVIVSAIDSSLDPDLVPGNIKKDVEIFGVTGTYEGSGGTVNNQDKSVNPRTSQQTVTADQGYTGLGTVTVNAVTSSIDSNISAGNIKKDVTILGVRGTYDTSVEMNRTTALTIDNVDISTLWPYPSGYQTLGMLQPTNVKLGGINENFVVNTADTLGQDTPQSWYYGYAIDGFANIDSSVSSNIKSITYNVNALLSRNGFTTSGPICTSTNAPGLQKISLPMSRLVSFGPYTDVTGWFTPWKDDIEYNLEWTWFHSSDASINLTHDLGSHLVNLTIPNNYIGGNNCYLGWASNLSQESVYRVLQSLYLGAGNNNTCTFYTGGLIVYDDAQGSIQTAYDTAVAAGWTIQNLTIMPNLIDTTTDLTSIGNNLTNSQIEELLNHVDTTYVSGRTLTFATGSNYETDSYDSTLYQRYVTLQTSAGWNLQNLFIGYPKETGYGWSADGKYRHYEFDFGTGQKSAVIESNYKGYSNGYMEHVGTVSSSSVNDNIWLETNDGGKTKATIGSSSSVIESPTNNISGTHTTAFGVLDDGNIILKPRANGTGLVISEPASGTEMVQAGSSNLRLPCKDFRFNDSTRGWGIYGFKVWHNWGTTGDRSDSATLVHDVAHIIDYQFKNYKMHDRVTDKWYDLIIENS